MSAFDQEMDVILEHTLFTTDAERLAIVADKGKVADILVYNFFGLLGMLNSAHAHNKPYWTKKVVTVFKNEKKAQLSQIGDENTDFAMSVKLAEQAGLWKSAAVVSEITRFIAKVRTGTITFVDNAKIKEWANGLKPEFRNHITNAIIKRLWIEWTDDKANHDISWFAAGARRQALRADEASQFKLLVSKFTDIAAAPAPMTLAGVVSTAGPGIDMMPVPDGKTALDGNTGGAQKQAAAIDAAPAQAKPVKPVMDGAAKVQALAIEILNAFKGISNADLFPNIDKAIAAIENEKAVKGPLKDIVKLYIQFYAEFNKLKAADQAPESNEIAAVRVFTSINSGYRRRSYGQSELNSDLLNWLMLNDKIAIDLTDVNSFKKYFSMTDDQLLDQLNRWVNSSVFGIGNELEKWLQMIYRINGRMVIDSTDDGFVEFFKDRNAGGPHLMKNSTGQTPQAILLTALMTRHVDFKSSNLSTMQFIYKAFVESTIAGKKIEELLPAEAQARLYKGLDLAMYSKGRDLLIDPLKTIFRKFFDDYRTSTVSKAMVEATYSGRTSIVKDVMGFYKAFRDMDDLEMKRKFYVAVLSAESYYYGGTNDKIRRIVDTIVPDLEARIEYTVLKVNNLMNSNFTKARLAEAVNDGTGMRNSDGFLNMVHDNMGLKQIYEDFVVDAANILQANAELLTYLGTQSFGDAAYSAIKGNKMPFEDNVAPLDKNKMIDIDKSMFIDYVLTEEDDDKKVNLAKMYVKFHQGQKVSNLKAYLNITSWSNNLAEAALMVLMDFEMNGGQQNLLSYLKDGFTPDLKQRIEAYADGFFRGENAQLALSLMIASGDAQVYSDNLITNCKELGKLDLTEVKDALNKLSRYQESFPRVFIERWNKLIPAIAKANLDGYISVQNNARRNAPAIIEILSSPEDKAFLKNKIDRLPIDMKVNALFAKNRMTDFNEMYTAKELLGFLGEVETTGSLMTSQVNLHKFTLLDRLAGSDSQSEDSDEIADEMADWLISRGATQVASHFEDSPISPMNAKFISKIMTSTLAMDSEAKYAAWDNLFDVAQKSLSEEGWDAVVEDCIKNGNSLLFDFKYDVRDRDRASIALRNATKSSLAHVLLNIADKKASQDDKNKIIDAIPPSVFGMAMAVQGVETTIRKEITQGAIDPMLTTHNIDIRTILKFNKLSMEEIEKDVGVKIRRRPREPQSSYYERFIAMNGSVGDKEMLESAKITPDDTTNLEQLSTKYFKERYAGKHGYTFPLIVKSWKMDFVKNPEGHEKFKTDHPDPIVMPAFHGCGGVAANMISRYGFAILPESGGGKAGIAIAGRMLGNGIYFAPNIDKSMQYVANTGFTPGGRGNIEGYIFELEVWIGESPKNYRSAGLGRDSIRSPEYAVFDPDSQIRIVALHHVRLIPLTEMKAIAKKHSGLNESTSLKSFGQLLSEKKEIELMPNVATFEFAIDFVPVKQKKGWKYISFDEAVKTNVIPEELISQGAANIVVEIPNHWTDCYGVFTMPQHQPDDMKETWWKLITEYRIRRNKVSKDEDEIIPAQLPMPEIATSTEVAGDEVGISGDDMSFAD